MHLIPVSFILGLDPTHPCYYLFKKWKRIKSGSVFGSVWYLFFVRTRDKESRLSLAMVDQVHFQLPTTNLPLCRHGEVLDCHQTYFHLWLPLESDLVKNSAGHGIHPQCLSPHHHFHLQFSIPTSTAFMGFHYPQIFLHHVPFLVIFLPISFVRFPFPFILRP
jgi:hypothetical protein